MLNHRHSDNLFVMVCVNEVNVIREPTDGEDDNDHDEHFDNLKDNDDFDMYAPNSSPYGNPFSPQELLTFRLDINFRSCAKSLQAFSRTMPFPQSTLLILP